MIKQFLILSLSVALLLAGNGQDVQCNSTSDSKTCGTAGASTWVAGATNKFKINECNNVGASLTNVFDTFCISCPQGGNSNTFANAAQNGCTNTATSVGANVACQSAGACSGCGNSAFPAFVWNKASDSTNCYITSCLAAPMPASGLTDNLCGSCGKTNKYVNSYGTACVNPTSGNCSRKTGWTDTDCQVCYANGAYSNKIKASVDKTSCIAKSNSLIIVFSALVIISLLI